MMRAWLIRFTRWAFCLAIPATLLFALSSVNAQRIVRLRPDRAAPGMNVIVEIIARVTSPAPLWFPGLADSTTECYPLYPSDTNRILTGPVQVSWRSHLMQMPIFVSPDADTGDVPIVVSTRGGLDTVVFRIAKPDHIAGHSGNIVLGNGVNGSLSPGNTLLIDGLSATNASITVSMQDHDTNTPGNPRLEPVTILSTGPIILSGSTISVDASGKNGGSGGGGGGSGYPGIGGIGFTGGGNCDSALSSANVGSDSDGTLVAGGRSITGVQGGGTDYGDQGGGGGTGAPFGNPSKASGYAGIGGGEPRAGGYGGGSGGGEVAFLFIEFGGGGGGFGTPGGGGLELAGAGINGGNPYGGRFLVPLCGGSGGGAGNTYDLPPGAAGGSGGGGGGSLSLISFDSISIINSAITANGDSGTSGRVDAAGGGGGSGGGIWLAGAKGIGGGGATISVAGGSGGVGSPKGFAGGAGGSGRIRIDGSPNSSLFSKTPQYTSGISVTPISSTLVGNSGMVSGVAADTLNTLDTVRIFYRSHHTGWQFLDTVRTKGRWSKWIPFGHDSLIYIMAIVQVNPIFPDVDNTEPDWIMSHVGLILLHHVPSPFLVVDSALNFGKVRLGYCPTRWLRIYNDGEAPLVIDSMAITGASDFKLLSGKTTISGYSTDSVEVEFCPDTLGLRAAVLTLISNDSEHLPKAIALSGIGIHRADSLRFLPQILHFGRVSIDSCKSDTVTLYSLGTDTLALDFSSWNAPPFKGQLIAGDSLLAPHDTARLLVTFCPVDTATAHGSVELDSRNDTLRMDGNGTVRRFEVQDTIDLGSFCAGTALGFSEVVRSTGNNVVTLVSVTASAANVQSTMTTPFVLDLNRDDTAHWLIQDALPGLHRDTLVYRSLDTTLRTIITYRAARPLITIDSASLLPFLCVSETDTFSFRLRNPTSDTVSISAIQLAPSLAFSLLSTMTPLAPGDSTDVRIAFHPPSVGRFVDSLQIGAVSFGCDTTYWIPIARTGSVDGLAADTADFGTLNVGDCKEDSINIQNTCGPAETIDTIVGITPAFTRLSLFPVTIPSKSAIRLHFRYCALKAGSTADTIVLVQRSGAKFSTILRGAGMSQVIPWAYFRLTNAPTIHPGDTARTELWFDSATLAGTHTLISTKISFDPSVVYPLGVTPGQMTRLSTDTIAIAPIALNFNKHSQFIESIDWLGLLGPKSSSTLGLEVIVDTVVDIHMRDGSISVQDCSGLNGQISVAGPYRLGQVIPDAAPGKGEVSVELGNDGFIEASIYDLTGRVTKTVLSEFRRAGHYAVSLPLSGVSSGRYFLVFSSLGWREVRPFILGP